MKHGLIVIDKERGLTSHQVVARLRGYLGQQEVGHTGTLDPEATGVLVVGLGDGTRSFQFLDEGSKLYRAEIIFGQATDTQDATGKVIKENRDFKLTFSQVLEAIKAMTGTIEQLPPMYSAVKQQGKKLYELARAGIEVDRPVRKIQVAEWSVDQPQDEYGCGDHLVCTISCSRGTYIRTLIHDLGLKLDCGAHMGSLRRLQSGVFGLEEALTLAQVEKLLSQQALDQWIISLAKALGHLPSLDLEEEDRVKVNNGGKLSFNKYPLSIKAGCYAKVIVENDQVLAIVRLEDTGEYLFWQPVKVFKGNQ